MLKLKETPWTVFFSWEVTISTNNTMYVSPKVLHSNIVAELSNTWKNLKYSINTELVNTLLVIWTLLLILLTTLWMCTSYKGPTWVYFNPIYSNITQDDGSHACQMYSIDISCTIMSFLPPNQAFLNLHKIH